MSRSVECVGQPIIMDFLAIDFNKYETEEANQIDRAFLDMELANTNTANAVYNLSHPLMDDLYVFAEYYDGQSFMPLIPVDKNVEVDNKKIGKTGDKYWFTVLDVNGVVYEEGRAIQKTN